MARKKCKRKSGYVTPDLVISKKNLVKFDLFVNPEYNDWCDYRDGFRDWFSDFKKIKKIHKGFNCFNEKFVETRRKMNKKQKKLIRIRRTRNIKFA
ncbi:hypothetical protein HZA97_08045 [Candidatus Woesearchaeota archaeon]|nr:hypothetical protein [Candidatus Woesearchaeota archaeon]